MTFALVILAVYRIVHMVIFEDGPFLVLARARAILSGYVKIPDQIIILVDYILYLLTWLAIALVLFVPDNYYAFILATYFASNIIASRDGPFRLFAYIRLFAAEHAPGWVHDGVTCVLCLSFWLSFVAALFMPGAYFLNALGIAGACTALHLLLYRG